MSWFCGVPIQEWIFAKWSSTWSFVWGVSFPPFAFLAWLSKIRSSFLKILQMHLVLPCIASWLCFIPLPLLFPSLLTENTRECFMIWLERHKMPSGCLLYLQVQLLLITNQEPKGKMLSTDLQISKTINQQIILQSIVEEDLLLSVEEEWD